MNISPNVHDNRKYIVNVQAQEASKRLGTSIRKVDIVIARKVKPLASAINRDIQEMSGGARICDIEISERCPHP